MIGRVAPDRHSRRRPARTTCALTMIGAMAMPAIPVQAAACPGPSSGVTVVVDFTAFGGDVEVRCAPGDPASGLAALHAAGFGTQGTQSDGPSFVCRIDGRPTPESESCVATPPADAFWTYTRAPRGGSWIFSSSSASNRDPLPGTVEGWARAGKQPGIAPPAAPPRLDDDPPPDEGPTEGEGPARAAGPVDPAAPQ